MWPRAFSSTGYSTSFWAGVAAFELVEVGSTARGTQALAQALAERRSTTACVVVDGMAGAEALCRNLGEVSPKLPKGYVVRPRVSDVVAAATGLHDALKEGRAVHADADKRLSDSALSSVRRPIGKNGGWGFGAPDDDHDSCPIEAAALALWGARTTRRNPGRRQRIL